ncbi:MAG: hypothetical protein J2P21_06475 [Chloracidobacterium sp.]|nr:hypothetical protein [Chloracidobacterium sp.]
MSIYMSARNLIAIFVLSWPLNASTTQVDSIYTYLAPSHCKTVIVDKELGESVQQCAGVAGYSLLLEDSDNRQSVTVVAPDRKRHPLNYSQVITSAFSTLGDKAEWRVKREGANALPIALIVRVFANEDSDSPQKRTSYLAVTKITREKICVTARIKGGATANEEARRAADTSTWEPCL